MESAGKESGHPRSSALRRDSSVPLPILFGFPTSSDDCSDRYDPDVFDNVDDDEDSVLAIVVDFLYHTADRT